MTVWQAIILGVLQGATEFLPVSSSGHIELGKVLLGVDAESDMAFTIALHGATVLSTIVALWPEIWQLLRGVFRFRWNDEMQYLVKIVLSMVPVALVGLLAKDYVESLFNGNLLVVGLSLLVTALLLWLASRGGEGQKESAGSVYSLQRQPSYLAAFVMGVGQAFAVLPGLSRSGTTISLGLCMRADRRGVAQFSFLMVLPPIIGMNILEAMHGFGEMTLGTAPLLAGVLSAFLVGYAACRWMIALVRRGRLGWFALYCAVVGGITVVLTLLR